ncbi:MAG: hypothetical protein ABFS32_14930 [Bacteroidota bacterium]
MRIISVSILLFVSNLLLAQNIILTVAEQSNYQQTCTYEEGMSFYRSLASNYKNIKIVEKGDTDSGLPLHLVLISDSDDFDIKSNRDKGKTILLINNAIHPGEPDGIEASQMLTRELLTNRKLKKVLNNTLVAIIPFYNIGGTLNRNTGSRANQNGPEEKGFRGNARNYDLNRDFIKNDTKNAMSFSEIFHELDPDVMIDTHVSNGADYQYVLTMVTPQSDKLGEPLKDLLDNYMMPDMYERMAKTGYEMTPYVNIWGSTPDKGWSQFFDSPRYSSGYAALFQTIAFQSETHMLKPFEQRINATYAYLVQMLYYLNEEGQYLRQVRDSAKQIVINQKSFPLTWTLDRSDSTVIEFKGYEATYPNSEISGLPRLKYDRSKPFTKDVPYYNTYKPEIVVSKPESYVIPQAWTHVISAMKHNNVKMRVLEYDTTVKAEVYYIKDYSTRNRPYEGHYYHDKVVLDKVIETVTFRKGDVIIPVNQTTNRYIVETLEPEGADSFFRWNFFDTILQMKEGYSSYVFEDEAIEILKRDKKLKYDFEVKKATDTTFRANGYAQLRYIFMNSEHREPSYLRYPVYRLISQ